MSFDILWLLQLGKDIFSENLSELNTHLICKTMSTNVLEHFNKRTYQTS